MVYWKQLDGHLIDVYKRQDFNTLIDLLDKDGEELGMKIHTMHEDIFDAMHKIWQIDGIESR